MQAEVTPTCHVAVRRVIGAALNALHMANAALKLFIARHSWDASEEARDLLPF